MNTFCEIQLESEDNVLAEETQEAVFFELRRIEHLFSRYIENSEIFNLNLYAHKRAIRVSDEVFDLILRALEFSKLTYGAFDVSIGAAIDLWRQAENQNALPAEAQIRKLKSCTGYRNITVDRNDQTIHFLNPEIRLDLGALAKGYALDRAIAILKKRGVQKAQINIGGNIYLLDTQPQLIALRNPLLPDETLTTVSILNSAISTSANYERFFTIANKRFGHILDPVSCDPVESDILSVSVISQDAALADAVSTAIFVLGLNEGRQLVKKLGIKAIVIAKAGFTARVKVYNLTTESG